eukprot:gnl/MRDRNA2_/MRDRNA2_57351_c0_seq1.p1 gnl/MRDRNA2_/MRDRNA2_57351_c0~~gnl/MRDRNA2_/MRDRNA2_57351_c0_seq1.p1  ORF type:complete len:101 (+),score=18.39 gnl/MRDRNA2_/MRDRNA2_57351_c0_seq1:137-439(+)
MVHGGKNPELHGQYLMQKKNWHNERPTYRRVDKDVWIFFWSKDDSMAGNLNNHGWWIASAMEPAPEKLYAYNASLSCNLPMEGWQLPHDGGVDDSFKIVV